MYCSQQE